MIQFQSHFLKDSIYFLLNILSKIFKSFLQSGRMLLQAINELKCQLMRDHSWLSEDKMVKEQCDLRAPSHTTTLAFFKSLDLVSHTWPEPPGMQTPILKVRCHISPFIVLSAVSCFFGRINWKLFPKREKQYNSITYRQTQWATCAQALACLAYGSV